VNLAEASIFSGQKPLPLVGELARSTVWKYLSKLTMGLSG